MKRMQYRIEILSQSMQGGLAAFFLLFVPLALWTFLRNRRRKAARLELIRRDYYEKYRDRLPYAVAAAVERPPLLPAIHVSLWTSLAASALTFLTLAFSSLSYFPNFRSLSADQPPGLELKTLHTDFQSQPMKIDGEVTNIGGAVLPQLHVHLVLYDQNLAVVTARTIDIEQPLAPSQTMPFFFSEERTDTIRRIGITFSSKFGPLIHRESAEAKQS